MQRVAPGARVAGLALAGLLAMTVEAKPSGPPSEAGKGDVLPFKATEKTLPNGLKVLVVPTGFPNIVSIQIPVQTGSRNEVEPGKTGFAHFFEHMMFRGTPSFPPQKYQAVLTQAGARSNAYTSDDYTNYHTTFAKEDLETVLRVEADRFANLSYGEEAFKTEARAVLGEYNKNSADPFRKLIEVQRDHAFSAHTYKHTTMGFLKDIEDMPNQFDYSKTFFERWYRPEHTTIIVAGDVSAEQAIPLVEKYWGGWQGRAYNAAIPAEPEPRGAVYAHVPWPAATLPWVSVAFHGPAFSDMAKDYAAVDALLDLSFGSTSDLYKRLVEKEQKVDQLFAYYPPAADPSLLTVAARVKKIEDTLYVRDEILKACAAARAEPVPAGRLADAKANGRYSLVRGLDNTEAIASTLARFVRFNRSFDTLNNFYRVYDSLSPTDLHAAAGAYFTDERLVVTTLSNDPMPEGMATTPSLASLGAAAPATDVKLVTLKSALPQLDIKLLFAAGSAHDPAGKDGLAALTASMIADAGSRAQGIDEIRKALFPMAGSFEAQVDKEMTTFTGVVHRDNWQAFLDVALPMLTDPGFREEDFTRVRDAQLNALVQDLRSDNDEELGRERLQADIFSGTPYGHTVVGTVAGIRAVSLDDVKAFARSSYTRANLTLGVSGDVPDGLVLRLKRELAKLAAGETLPASKVVARPIKGRQVEIVEKDTRATAISFGHPIAVTRTHPDYAALWVARTWLGEHRSSLSHLYERIREVRGLNYGDYAYIEAFPRAMFQFFPDPNIARRAQIFDVWIRPVVPENAQMALRIALHELEALIQHGLTQEQFDSTRNYLMKNVYVMTATQDQQLGYALDSAWYGMGEFTAEMRERFAKLRRADVNAAIRRHLSAHDISIVIVTKDAKGLAEKLKGDGFSSVHYDAEKPPELLAEDKRIGAEKLNIQAGDVRITPVDEVFAR